MENTNSPYEQLTGVIIMFVLVSLTLFVLFAQSCASLEMQTIIQELFSH